MAETSTIERALRRDRAIVISALCLIICVSWIYVLMGAGMRASAFDMTSISMALGKTDPMLADGIGSRVVGGAMVAMATPAGWTYGYAVLMFFMWWIMMIAMMLPSTAPMVLLHATVIRRSRARTHELGDAWPTAGFALGYLLVWAAFGAAAAALQWAFERAGLLSPMMMNSNSTLFAGAILMFAGVYQLTPLKQACLRHCRGPIGFVTRHWRAGTGGALVMGLQHGAYCLGCCWGLMAILFFGGVMNLYWIIGLALLVLLEKLLPVGRGLSLIIAGLLLVWGVGFLYRAWA